MHFINKVRIVQNTGMDSLDDFGVDLYAIPEPVASKIDLDENTRIAAMLNTTATEWQRYMPSYFPSCIVLVVFVSRGWILAYSKARII